MYNDEIEGKKYQSRKVTKYDRYKSGWTCQTHDLGYEVRINFCKANQNKLWSSIPN